VSYISIMIDPTLQDPRVSVVLRVELCFHYVCSHSSGPPGSPWSSSLVPLKLDKRAGSTDCTSTSSLSSVAEYLNSTPGSKKLVNAESEKVKEEVVAITDIGGYDV